MSSKNSARKESEADLDVAPAANFVDFSPDEIKDVQLHECIWQGPYSTTFRATYKPSGEVVAVKILYLNRPEVRVESTKQLTKLAKAKSVCADGISKVLAFGETNSAIFVVRQYIEGISLLQAISQGAIPPRDAVRHARDIALAIDEASAQGVTHCGIRPSQIVLCSKNHGTFEKHGVVLDHASLMAIVTDLGALAPSLRWDRRLMPPVAMWMPPEQLAQSTALESLRVDVYSIGAVLYFMLTGRPPFFVAGGELLGQLISSELPARASQLNPLVDSSLDAIVFRCIEKNPRDRFESASALADELDAYLNIPSERFGVVSRGQCRRDVASRVEFRRITQCLIAMAVCLAGALIWFQPTMKMDSSRKFQVSEGDIGDSIFYRNCIAAAILKANSNDSDGALAVLVGASDVSRGWEWGVTRRLCSATGVPVDDEGTWGWCSDVKVSGEQFEVRKSKKYALHRVAEMQGFVGIRIFVDLGGGLQWGGSNVVGDLGDVGIALCESSCFVDCEFCDGFDASKACSCRTQDCSALKVGVGCFCVQESFCKRDVSISRLAQSVIVSGCWGSWELFDLEGHESFVRVATVSGDRRWLATGDDDGFVVITDLWEGKQKVRCPVSLGAIRDLSFDPDSGDLLIASGCDIRSWRTESMVDVPCVATRNTGCAVVAFHLIEKSFLSGGQDGAIAVSYTHLTLPTKA